MTIETESLSPSTIVQRKGIFNKVVAWPTSFKLGILIIGIVALASIFAPLLTPYDPIIGDFDQALQPPS